MDVLENYEIRKSKKQKTAFIGAVTDYARAQGYSVQVEKRSMGCRNIVIGDPERAKYLITAHYDTCAGMLLPNFVTPFNLVLYLCYQFLLVGLIFVAAGVAGYAVQLLTDNAELAYFVTMLAYFMLLILMMIGPANRHTANDNTSGVVTVLEIAASLPQNLRERVCFVLFDLEEAGLIGSAAYRKAHKKQTNSQIVINLDCVGDGDELLLIPGKKIRSDKALMAKCSAVCGTFGKKKLSVHKKGLAVYPSDQNNFPLGIAVAAFRRKKGIGLYYGRIHTHRDTILDRTNVNILRAALISLVANPK